MAVGGLGGCPFAQDTLVGNIATEQALAQLAQLGAVLPQITALPTLSDAAQAIAGKYGPTTQ
jgi:hydroxymethylglutaryl-CoA lyase